MSSKRKAAEMSETDFKFLHERLSVLAKHSTPDARSFLLFIKSLMPNSLKLRLLEYGFSKDNGDSIAAAQQLSQLCTSHRDSLRDEANALFSGITSSDRISLDIFTKLTPTAQRDILSIYFEHGCELLTKIDTLMCLLNSREIRAQSQLVPTLLAWTYDNLREGELNLLRSSVDTPVDSPPMRSPDRSMDPQNTVHKLTDVMDEGEEGEVLGDDEEEEEEEDETSGTKLENNNQRAVKKLTINVYKLKMAFELLPVMHKLRDTVKIDRKLLEGVTTSSLGFLCHYLSSYPPEPPVIGTHKPLTDLCKAAPKDYFRSCLGMCGELLQWSHEILTQPERSTSTTEPSPKYPLKSAENLVVVFEQCMEEVRRHAASGSNETTPKKRRSSQRKTDAHHNIKALVSQAACLFWYLLVHLGLDYFSQERPNVFTVSDENSVSYHPVNLSRLLPEVKVSPDLAKGNLDSSPILLLSRLWQWLKYDSGSGKVSLGYKDIDSWMGKLGFQLPVGIPHPDISLETLVYADLLFLYPEYSNVQSNKPLSELFCTPTTTPNCFLAYSPLIREFLHWLSVACDVTSPDPSIKSKNQFELQSDFIQQLSVVANNAPINASFLPKHIHGQLWMIPLVQPVIDYLGCKVISSWLSLIFRECATLPNAVQADTASLLACLGQVDTLTQFGAVFSTPNTLPFTEILRSLNAHWPYARKKFASWFKRSPRVIEDSGLLSQLAHIEVEYRDSGGSTNSSECPDFLVTCVDALKSTCKEDICARLRGFIESEMDTILSCLKATE
ncbi:hypothetical protein CRM22_001378 [Opisthorchis felineus]|uniref:Uncharacterized protein n=2 Tax=Opisthorchis felineus TaxID=147828 RepID=A0A4S2MAT3_OPIFE|nr:hypothetical protein CRM22_001378 [Opisthorchis felineus]